MKIIYRSPNTRQRRKIDEIMIIQHNRIVFKGCLRDGGKFLFHIKIHLNVCLIFSKINLLLNHNVIEMTQE